MKTELYIIEALTNIHVGSGDINFDIVDNQVQRDTITTLPIIHSSSLKGAFREHFRDKGKQLVTYIFGPENDESDSHQSGAYSFFEAELLSRPVRSNKKAYFNAISPSVIKHLLQMSETFGIDLEEKELLETLSNLNPIQPIIFEDIQGVILEDDEAEYQNIDVTQLKSLLGENLALFSDESFKKLDLPVIARNKIAKDENDDSNLWYEEIVPKKSKFFFFIAKPEDDNLDPKDKQQKIDGFDRRFENEGEIIQIGANKSIGYGFCKIKRISK